MTIDSTVLREQLDERARSGEFSGSALVWMDGRPVFEHAAGWASRGHKVPNRPDTRYAVASITKMVTATAALQLVEDGTVALDQPLVEILAEDRRPAALTDAHTLHHLLAHTSGLTNYHDDDDETPASWMAAWGKIQITKARAPGDMLPMFVDLPAHSPPGREFKYGDVNYVLAGLVIESVTGRSYYDVVAERVLEPAGMTDSGFPAADTDPDRVAVGYMETDDSPDSWPSNVFSVPPIGMPDGGLITTTTDLARFMDALVVHRSLLTPTSLELMCTPNGLINNNAEAYGYGMEMLIVDDEPVILGHAGGDPGVSAMLSHYVGPRVTVAVLCNFGHGSWSASQIVAAAVGLDDPRV